MHIIFLPQGQIYMYMASPRVLSLSSCRLNPSLDLHFVVFIEDSRCRDTATALQHCGKEPTCRAPGATTLPPAVKCQAPGCPTSQKSHRALQPAAVPLLPELLSSWAPLPALPGNPQQPLQHASALLCADKCHPVRMHWHPCTFSPPHHSSCP
jgi:hypothetical protein